MKARHLCAVCGIALAVGTVVFMQSLVATNDKQSLALAEQLQATVPVAADAQFVQIALDYRPDGRVMQGPPMMTAIATQPGVEGIVLAKSVFAPRRLTPPPIGTELTLVGRNGAYKLPITGYLDWERAMGRGASYPNAFVSPETAATIGENWRVFEPPTTAALAATFKSDAGRNFDRAKALLLWGAALTALCLLMNSLFLSVEARRKELAILRVIGLTKAGLVRLMAREAVAMSFAGLVVGVIVALAALFGYVACDPVLFPRGMAVSLPAIGGVTVLSPLLALAATLAALKPALGVKPLEAASFRAPKKRTRGMLLSFAFGFGAFVAVEVWGASLMRAFVPSQEWPDAIVSILPGGVSSFEIEKLKNLEGVARLAELQPLQVNLAPLEELPARGRLPGGRKSYRNVLLLASDWMPDFKLVDGSLGVSDPDSCVITEMMARAYDLEVRDLIHLDLGETLEGARCVQPLTVMGIVDLNWHMVTSRGLVRGLNRMPGNTDGPIFVSFDTLAGFDRRPSFHVPMTHLWLSYKPAFLKEHGVFEAGRIVEKDIVKALNGAAKVTEVGDVRGNTVRLHARDEIADGTLAHGDDLIGSMARVPFIFLAVVSLGFIALLVASVESRKREFAVLRAVGATRGDLVEALLREAWSVAEKGIACGFLGGALVGWLFTFVTRQAMAQWGLPPHFAVPWMTICTGALGAMLFVCLVAIPTSCALIYTRIKR